MLLRMLSACYPGIVSHDQSDSPMRIWGQDQDPSNETIVDIFGHEQSQDFSQCLSSDVLPNSSFQANIMVPKVILYSCSFLIVLLRAATVLVDTCRVTVFLWAQARVGPFSLELGQSVVKLVPSLCRKMPNSFGVAWFFCFRRARTLEGVFEPLSAETACNCKFMASRVQIFWIRCDSCPIWLSTDKPFALSGTNERWEKIYLKNWAGSSLTWAVSNEPLRTRCKTKRNSDGHYFNQQLRSCWLNLLLVC